MTEHALFPGARSSALAAGPAERSGQNEPILRVENLQVRYPVRTGLLRRATGAVRAVDDVSFDVFAGQTLGLVGESGCGKSTTALATVRLVAPSAGRIMFAGADLASYSHRRLRSVRRGIQLIFQDSQASLDPRVTIGASIAEPLHIHRRGSRKQIAARVGELLDMVGLARSHADRFPHQFSGGQLQRVGIARALALEPRVLVLDEPVSALDVSVQAQVLGLLEELQSELGLAYLFISHDLSVVRHLADRVAVMYLGRIVEIGQRREVYDAPAHPYTQSLLSSVPRPESAGRRPRSRIVLHGDVPSPADPPSGCRFRTRCWKAEPRCAEEVPQLEERAGTGTASACHFARP